MPEISHLVRKSGTGSKVSAPLCHHLYFRSEESETQKGWGWTSGEWEPQHHLGGGESRPSLPLAMKERHTQTLPAFLQTPTPVSREGIEMLAWSPVCVSGGLSVALDPLLQRLLSCSARLWALPCGQKSKKDNVQVLFFSPKASPSHPLGFLGDFNFAKQ